MFSTSIHVKYSTAVSLIFSIYKTFKIHSDIINSDVSDKTIKLLINQALSLSLSQKHTHTLTPTHLDSFINSSGQRPVLSIELLAGFKATCTQIRHTHTHKLLKLCLNVSPT